jgi:hypothetical protein
VAAAEFALDSARTKGLVEKVRALSRRAEQIDARRGQSDARREQSDAITLDLGQSGGDQSTEGAAERLAVIHLGEDRSRPGLLAELERTVLELGAEADAAVIDRISGLVEAASTAGTAQVRAICDTVRRAVERENNRLALRRSNRETIEALVRQLDGFVGSDVSSARALLGSAQLDEPLPAFLPEFVRSARAVAEAEAARQYVLGCAAAVMEELGYWVGTGFATAVATEGALVALQSADHALRVRESGGGLHFDVVRFDEAGARNPAVDMSVEAGWYEQIPVMKRAFAAHGVRLDIERSGALGHPLEVERERPDWSGLPSRGVRADGSPWREDDRPGQGDPGQAER